ncbi:MAG TPA: hypothetical protein ENN41_04965, partial [Sediminispirochaeta sp.]|nr:hypothetical protein [Sediminispirochaeta sp.]
MGRGSRIGEPSLLQPGLRVRPERGSPTDAEQLVSVRNTVLLEKKMKKTILTFCLLTSLAISNIASVPPPRDESVALADSASAGFVNPAALSFGSGQGFGYLHGFDRDGLIDDYALYFNSPFLGYSISQTQTGHEHGLRLSLPLFRNLYFGAAARGESFDPAEAAWDFGLLYRPTDYLSLGSTATLSAGGQRSYTSGVALRPLALLLPELSAHRLSLFADVDWWEEAIGTPKIGLRFMPLTGLEAGFAYDAESDSFGFSVSYAANGLRLGSYSEAGEDWNMGRGVAYAQVGLLPFNLERDFDRRSLYYDYELGPEIVEMGQSFKFGPMYLLSDQNSLRRVLTDLEEIEKSEHIDGMLFVNQHPRMSLNTVLELRQALQRIRESGKKIVFYSDYMSTTDYLLAASSADEIFLHPQGMIHLRGVSASGPYLKGFLDKYGISVLNMHSGDYKSAYNFLSESSMPTEEREALDYLLQGIFDEMAGLIEDGRGERLQAPAAELIEAGPYFQPERALDAGLIDGLVQRDEFRTASEFIDEDTLTQSWIQTRQVRTDWSEEHQDRVALI